MVTSPVRRDGPPVRGGGWVLATLGGHGAGHAGTSCRRRQATNRLEKQGGAAKLGQAMSVFEAAGNFLLLPGGRLGMLDFGAVAAIPGVAAGALPHAETPVLAIRPFRADSSRGHPVMAVSCS